MEPISVLMSALSLAGTVLKPVTDQAVKDAYVGLKALIVRKFGRQQPLLATTLEQHAEDPKTWEAPVEKMLKDSGADKDQELLQAAANFLNQAEAHQPGITNGVAQIINAQKIGVVGTNFGPIDMRS